jgi:hypothetical protein
VLTRLFLILSLCAACGDPAGNGPRAPAPSWRADQVFGPRLPVPGEPDAAEQGPLRVVYFSPVHEAGELVGLTAIFNLDLPPEVLAGPVFELEPPVSGSTTALGARAVMFRAAEPFALATRFYVSVPPSMQSADGRALEEEPLWSVATQRPSLLDAEAVDRDGRALVMLRFNQTVDLGVLERKLALVARRKPVPYRLSHTSDPGVVEVTPRQRVAPGTTFQLTIQLGVQGVEGRLPSVQTERRTLDSRRAARPAAPTPSAKRSSDTSIEVTSAHVVASGPVALPVRVRGARHVDVRWWPATPADYLTEVEVPLVRPQGRARVAVQAEGVTVTSMPEGRWIVEVAASDARGAMLVQRASLEVDVWRDPASALVRVRQAGRPVVADVAWLGILGHTLTTARTSAEGRAMLAPPPGAVAVRAVAGRRRGFAANVAAAQPLRAQGPRLFAARRTLRPGAQVRIVGASRAAEVSLEAVGPTGVVKATRRKVVDGGFVWEWALPELPAGPLWIRAHADASSELELVIAPRGEAEGTLEVEAAPDVAVAGEDWTVALRARDSVGSPWSGEVTWRLVSRPASRAVVIGGYGAGVDPLADLTGSLTLDEAGRGIVGVPTPVLGTGGAWMELTLRAAGLQGVAPVVVQGRSVVRGPGLRLRPSRRILRPGERLTVEVDVIDGRGQFERGWRGYLGLELWSPEKGAWRRVAPCLYDDPSKPQLCGFVVGVAGQYRLRFAAAAGHHGDLSDVASAPGLLMLDVDLAAVGQGYSPPASVPRIWIDPGDPTRVLLHAQGEVVLPPGDAVPVSRMRSPTAAWEMFELSRAELPVRVGVGTQWEVVGSLIDRNLPLQITAEPSVARPGDDVTLTVKTQPGARITVDAIDARLEGGAAFVGSDAVRVAPSRSAQGGPVPLAWTVTGTADADGAFRFVRPLPQGVGSHAFVAFAHDGQGRIGHGAARVRAEIPLVVTGSVPERVGIRDTAFAEIWLENRAASAAVVDVEFNGEERRVEVPPGARRGVPFRLPVDPGGHALVARASPNWACRGDGCPPPGDAVARFALHVDAGRLQHRFAASRGAGASLRVVEVPDGATVTLRLSPRALAPHPRGTAELTAPLPWALRRALLDTESAADLHLRPAAGARARALTWARECLVSRSIPPAARAVCAVLVTAADPNHVKVVRDLEPLAASELPVWARAWLAIAWDRRLERVSDKRPLEAALERLQLPDSSVDPSGLGTDTLTRASVLLALLHARPNDARIPELVRGLVRFRASGAVSGPFSDAVAELALRRVPRGSSALGPPVPVEVWVDDVRVRRVGLGGAEERVELALRPGRHEVVVAGPQDTAFWHALELAWPEPPPPTARGFSLTRSMAPGPVRVGETVEVELAFVVTAERGWVELDGGVPAGFRVAHGEATALFPKLAPGIYTHRYTLEAVRSGAWYLAPARLQALEQPWLIATTRTAHLRVRPR